MGLAGLIWNPWLVFIALFVWIGGVQEAAAVRMRAAFEGLLVRDAVQPGYRALSPDEPLESILEIALEGDQQDFPVVEDGRIIGVIKRADLLEVLRRSGKRPEKAVA